MPQFGEIKKSQKTWLSEIKKKRKGHVVTTNNIKPTPIHQLFFLPKKIFIKYQQHFSQVNSMEVEPEDPMDAVEESEAPMDEVQDPDLENMMGQPLADCGGLQLQMTASGARQALGRKVRPRPILRLVCTGCSLSTHDPDIFVAQDFLEQLGFNDSLF